MTVQSSNIAMSYWTFKDRNIREEYSSVDLHLRRNTDNLIFEIKALLIDDQTNIENSFEKLFDNIFKLRIDSLNWINDNKFNTGDLLKSMYEIFESRDIPEQFDYLNENVLFAIRTTSKIATSIFSNTDSNKIVQAINQFQNSSDPSKDTDPSETPYSNLVNSIKLISKQLPNNSLLQLIELIKHSLIVELGIFSSDITFDYHEKLNISEAKIQDLSEVLINSSQTYGALAMEIGLIENRQNNEIGFASSEVDDEDQFLANLGLAEFFNNIESNE